MSKLSFIFFLILLTCPATILHARIIHVPGDEPTIEGGMDAAVDGDTVMVAPGTYMERNIFFRGKAITVMSTDPDDPGVVSSTIVDANSQGVVFGFQDAEDRRSVLAGLTITGGRGWESGGGIHCNGSSPTIINNFITGNESLGMYWDGKGGGIYTKRSSAVISNNTFTDNYARGGGGISCGGPVIISNNIITGNSASGWGGGIDCRGGGSIITHNLIENNSAVENGGGISGGGSSIISYNTIRENSAGAGGGMWYSGSSGESSNNLILNNSAGSGGGIRLDGIESTLLNNTISGNSADYGGGIWSTTLEEATIEGCIITANSAKEDGGGVYCSYGLLTLINSTITENTASNGGGVLSKIDMAIVNGILWGNHAGTGKEIYLRRYHGDPSALTISYSDVEGGQASVYLAQDCTLDWGDGMIDADPLFVDNKYHLQSGSPCVDAGDPEILDSCGPPGLGEERSDMGSYGGEENCGWVTERLEFDIVSDVPIIIARGDTLAYAATIQDHGGDGFAGDHWVTILLPDSNEIVVPKGLFSIPNPMSVQMPPFGYLSLKGKLFIPLLSDTTAYLLTARIGTYPDSIIDEESITFRVGQPGRTIRIPGNLQTIQEGIDVSLDGDTVLVADGVYTGDGNRDIDLQGKAIVVMSENGPDVTIIDCEADSTDQHRGFYLSYEESPGSALRGFTITNGYMSSGGAIVLYGADPIITDCVITGNSAVGSGGGIYGSFANATITDCVITGNRAGGNRGGYGGAAYFRRSDPEISDSFVTGNSAATNGGGLYFDSRSHPKMRDNSITGNSASSSGGGIYSTGNSDLMIANGRITGNSSGERGGGIFVNGGFQRIFASTIVGNVAKVEGGGISGMDSNLRVINSIIWDNAPDGISGAATVTHSDVQGSRPGEGNIEEDPMFLFPESGDYRLLWGSPCIDAGKPGYLDPDMTRSDMGAFPYDQNEQITLYLTPDTTEVARGEQLGVTYTLINRWEQPETFLLESEIILPDSSEVNVFGPEEFTLPGESTDQFYLVLDIPESYPLGDYEYRSWTFFPLASIPGEDRFMFRVVE